MISVVEEKGVTYPTFRRHVNKLVQQGLIKEPKYELVKEMFVEEADEKEVLEHLEVLNKEENPEVLIHRLKVLNNIARSKRIALIPNLLKYCEGYLENPIFYCNEKVLEKLIELFENMLFLKDVIRHLILKL